MKTSILLATVVMGSFFSLSAFANTATANVTLINETGQPLNILMGSGVTVDAYQNTCPPYDENHQSGLDDDASCQITVEVNDPENSGNRHFDYSVENMYSSTVPEQFNHANVQFNYSADWDIHYANGTNDFCYIVTNATGGNQDCEAANCTFTVTYYNQHEQSC